MDNAFGLLLRKKVSFNANQRLFVGTLYCDFKRLFPYVDET